MPKSRSRFRIEKHSSTSIAARRSDKPRFRGERFSENATVDCGWGKLIFAHTFEDSATLADTILDEKEGRRNLALYLRDPQVVLSLAPQELFLDPSHTYRLWLAKYQAARILPSGFSIRRLQTREDADEIHRVLLSCRMVSATPEFIWEHRASRAIQYFVAEDDASGSIVGTVTAIDHTEAFDDPENGSSLWCLAVDPRAGLPGIGRALVAHVADHFTARGRSFLDLSVMHDNVGVIKLYESLGFDRVPAFCIKRRNAINRELYIGRQPDTKLNPYAKIIVDEALKRGISVDVQDTEYGYFMLSSGGRRISCRESLSDLTTAVAMSRCDNKIVTHRILSRAGVRVPAQQRAGDVEANRAFLAEHGRIVVKPASGEQGRGVSVDIRDEAQLDAAIEQASQFSDEIVLEELATGQDLRVLLIDYEVVAAAIRKPAAIVGNGKHTIAQLIEKQSRRRSAATGGESAIPVDDETTRCVERQGLSLDDVLEEGRELEVRATANLHTGGTLHDVTGSLSSALTEVSRKIAQELDIPVVGLDFIVDGPSAEDYMFIEANERPGLANHEPQPTAERFIDLLFPETATDEAA